MTSSPRAPRRGFTLPELLIFVAIFAVVIVGFLTMFVTATRIQSEQGSSTEVASQAQFLIQQVGYYVQSARLIDLPQDTATGTLVLRESLSAAAADPTELTLASGTVYLAQGLAGTPQALTSNKVTVSALTFTRHFNANGSSTAFGQDSVSYSFVMSGGAPGTSQYYSHTYQSSATVLAPVGVIALVQQAKAENNNTGIASIAASYGTANDAGSVLVAVVSNTGNASATVSIADTAGNAWEMVANPAYAAYNQETAIFAAANVRNATNTVTATFGSGVNFPSIFIYEYRGASLALPVDATSSALNANSASPSSGYASAMAAPELALGVMYSNPATEIPAAGTGFTMETTSSVSGTYVEDRALYVTGPVRATFGYTQTAPSSSVAVVTLSSQDSTNGLAGYWPFDEGSGSVAYDASGNGNNGTWSGTTSGNNSTYYATGKVGGYAGAFDGATDQTSVGDPAILQNATGSFSVAAWVYATSTKVGMEAVDKAANILAGGNTYGGWALGEVSGAPIFKISDSADGTYATASTSTTYTGQWVHLAGVRSGNTILLYVNGASAGSASAVGVNVNIDKTLVVGGHTAAWLWPGYIDDVRIWNRALSPAEVSWIYNAQK